MEIAGPGRVYWTTPYRGASAVTVVAGGADPGGCGSTFGLFSNAALSKAPGSPPPATTGPGRCLLLLDTWYLVLLRILFGRLRLALPCLAVLPFLTSPTFAQPVVPPTAIRPPVRSAPPPATRGLLLDACALGSTIFAVGERGALIRSDDSGQNWDAIDVPLTATFTGITFADTHRGWIVGHDGAILLTTDSGLSWSPYVLKDGGELSLLDVLSTDLHNAMAVGAFGTCLVTADAGRTWTPRKVLDEDLHLNRLTRGRGTEFFIAGERGTLLRFAEIRAEPEHLKTGYDGSFNGVLLLPERGLLAYGLRGHVFHSDDNGDTWSAVPDLPPVLVSTGIMTRTGVVVLAGQARVFLISRDEGRTFSVWTPPITTAVAKIIEAPDGSLLTFGDSGVNRLQLPAPTAPSLSRPTSSPTTFH